MQEVLKRYGWWILPFALLLNILLIVHYRRTIPNEGDWRSAAQHIRTAWQPGDGVTWHPFYVTEGLPHLHGTHAFETPSLAEADFAAFDRVWILVSHGESLEGISPIYRPKHIASFGVLDLFLSTNEGERIVADLYTDLETVELYEGGSRRCDFWANDGWHCLAQKKRDASRKCLSETTSQRLTRFRRRRDPHCGLSPWFHVSRDVRVIDRHPRKCVWIHPKASAPFRLKWTPKSEGNALQLNYGFTDRVISMHDRPKPRTKPAKINLRYGNERQVIDVAPETGWFQRRYEAKSGRFSTPIFLEVTTSNPVDAHLCISLSIRKERP